MRKIMKSQDIGREQKTKYLVMTGLFAAITFMAITFFQIKIGVGEHIVHVGDSMIYLSACILPTPYAMAAGAIGAALSDFTAGYIMYVLPTFIIKAVMAVYFTNQSRILCKRNVIASVVAGVTGMLGYAIADIIFTRSLGTGVAAAIAQIPQLVGSMIVFLAVGMAMDKAKIVNRVSLR